MVRVRTATLNIDQSLALGAPLDETPRHLDESVPIRPVTSSRYCHVPVTVGTKRNRSREVIMPLSKPSAPGGVDVEETL